MKHQDDKSNHEKKCTWTLEFAIDGHMPAEVCKVTTPLEPDKAEKPLIGFNYHPRSRIGHQLDSNICAIMAHELRQLAAAVEPGTVAMDDITVKDGRVTETVR